MVSIVDLFEGKNKGKGGGEGKGKGGCGRGREDIAFAVCNALLSTVLKPFRTCTFILCLHKGEGESKGEGSEEGAPRSTRRSRQPKLPPPHQLRISDRNNG